MVVESYDATMPAFTSQYDTLIDDEYDLICVGFGPASLAIAIALHDSCIQAKVLFLEKQEKFVWHAGMLLPGSRMQISFLKDLATMRNPQSEFTFVNYLHARGRLVQFINLDTFLPLREEYNDYMRWCAQRFEAKGSVRYNEEVTSIQPIGGDDGSPIRHFSVHSTSLGIEKVRSARHVVIAIGGRPMIPKSLPQNHARVIHSSKYAWSIPKVLSNSSESYQIAVVGAGQSAAEIFSDLYDRYPNATIKLFIRGSALRPSDDSPFVNEVFNPERVDDTFSESSDMRQISIAQNRGTNYGVVRLELLERLYNHMYTQKLHNDNESTWRLKIHPQQEIVAASDMGSKIGVKVHNIKTGEIDQESRKLDMLIVATGYQRNMHEEMISGTKFLMAKHNRTKTAVNRDYSVQFEEGKVSKDAGIWLQGCNESTHGLSDTLLSILSVRAGEIVSSIFGDRNKKEN